ncbi:hypothetical protein [uncultured Psychroserpens sp.]|uniref:hypothetical protein n=1 Tax=uncultured Psychroserpens sp. TaxID=255436 RepID=UPI00263951AB|nr:hypothetical protein [uncultured Psychroserpens sp.]
MKTNKDIQDKVNTVLNSVDTIKDVKVSPFFKDKMLSVLFSEKREMRQVNWTWFTPKFQLATLFCFIVLNVFTLTQINNSTYDDYISDFAELYDLTTHESNSLLTDTYEDQ